ncbi:MAG: hypothetical protein ACE5GD_06865 [Candidatus Geothermarchaeales archaeon]
MVKKMSISLPDDLTEKLFKASRDGRTRSSIIAEALRVYLGVPETSTPKTYPTVLWKLRASGAMRLRSPRMARARVGVEWIVEPEV